MALAALQLVKSSWIRIKWELRDLRSALAAGPVSLVHLSLKSAATVVVKSHFAFYRLGY